MRKARDVRWLRASSTALPSVVNVGNHDARALPRERNRDSLAQARGSSGNDGNFVFQAHAWLMLPLEQKRPVEPAGSLR